jgi:hypothetical protein
VFARFRGGRQNELEPNAHMLSPFEKGGAKEKARSFLAFFRF